MLPLTGMVPTTLSAETSSSSTPIFSFRSPIGNWWRNCSVSALSVRGSMRPIVALARRAVTVGDGARSRLKPGVAGDRVGGVSEQPCARSASPPPAPRRPLSGLPRVLRAAGGELLDHDGAATNAVYGFTSMLINVLRDEQPTPISGSRSTCGRPSGPRSTPTTRPTGPRRPTSSRGRSRWSRRCSPRSDPDHREGRVRSRRRDRDADHAGGHGGVRGAGVHR